SSSRAVPCCRPASRRWSGSRATRSTSPIRTARSSRTSAATSRSRARRRSRGRSSRACPPRSGSSRSRWRPAPSTAASPAAARRRMSSDTDKLIRQLSLVAFLMAERRPLTARDVKSHVEGYSEMSDEAFARRFYSDRAELLSLGVPLHSQRDEFTGEELYTLRSEQYFLPQLELEDEELAALQTAFYLLEGKFAYAEPLRLALQNLALGRPG